VKIKNSVVVIAFVIVVFMLILSSFSISPSNKVAIIPVSGVIVSEAMGGFSSATVSSDVVSFLKKANEDSGVKAIILEINSPGGTPVASKEIADAVSSVDKPVIAVIREVGASGAYWVASASDKIVSDEVSIVGSIGVLASYVEISGLLNDFNITYERIVGGKYKDIGTPLKPLSADEREILQGHVDKLHEFFVTEVASNRNMDVSAVEELATGEFWLGLEAKEKGLVDGFGSTDDVIDDLEKEYGSLEEVVYVIDPSLFDLLGSVKQDFSFSTFSVPLSLS